MKNESNGVAVLILALIFTTGSTVVAMNIKGVGVTPYDDLHPSMAVTREHPEKVRLMTAFEVKYDESDNDVYLAYSSNMGQTWALIKPAGTNNNNELSPRIAIGLDDTLHLVYQSGDTLGYKKASPYNWQWTEYSWANTWSAGCRHADVCIDPKTNDLWIVMEVERTAGNHDICVFRLGTGGDFVLDTIAETPNDETMPVIECDGKNVLVLYEYHDGANVDIKGAVSKTGTPSFTSLDVAATPNVEQHPEITLSQAGFEYVYQSSDSLYYGFSADAKDHVQTALIDVTANAAPTISVGGNVTDILMRLDALTLRHLRFSAHNPAGNLKISDAYIGDTVSAGARQLAVVSLGDSAFCVWSGKGRSGKSENILGTCWTSDKGFAVEEKSVPKKLKALGLEVNSKPNGCFISLHNAIDRDVDIAIFDACGRKVRKLYKGSIPSGDISIFWNGCDENNCKLAKGVYFVNLKTATVASSAKILLLY